MNRYYLPTFLCLVNIQNAGNAQIYFRFRRNVSREWQDGMHWNCQQTHVKIKRRLTEDFLKLTPKLVLNDALTEFHEENFMRLRYFQEFVKMR